MSSKMGNWIIALGVLGVCVGLVCIPAALVDKSDASVLAFGACLFSMGALLAAVGMYAKAKAVAAAPREEAPSVRKVRGGCDICHGDVPIIACKVHNIQLCAACLAEHYDFRSCAYVPATRRSVNKPRAAAKALGM